jgi:hypothetical protein
MLEMDLDFPEREEEAEISIKLLEEGFIDK